MRAFKKKKNKDFSENNPEDDFIDDDNIENSHYLETETEKKSLLKKLRKKKRHKSAKNKHNIEETEINENEIMDDIKISSAKKRRKRSKKKKENNIEDNNENNETLEFENGGELFEKFNKKENSKRNKKLINDNINNDDTQEQTKEITTLQTQTENSTLKNTINQKKLKYDPKILNKIIESKKNTIGKMLINFVLNSQKNQKSQLSKIFINSQKIRQNKNLKIDPNILNTNYQNLTNKIKNLSYTSYNYTLKETDFFKLHEHSIKTILTNEDAAIKKCEELFNSIPENSFFIDTDFGPQNKTDFQGYIQAIYGSQIVEYLPGIPPPTQIDWEPIFKNNNAKFCKGSIESNDVMQGTLSDCWFISALAAISNKDYLFKGEIIKCFLDDGILDNEEIFMLSNGVYPPIFHYFRRKGIFCFRFFKNSKWAYVIIDGRIPCDMRNGFRYIFSHCRDSEEFWLPLVEKAYAKLHGGYIALNGGSICEGIRDLTGLFAENIFIKEEKSKNNIDDLWEKIKKYTSLEYENINNLEDNENNDKNDYKYKILNKNNTIVGCILDYKEQKQIGINGISTGLYSGHAYCILDAFEISKKKRKNCIDEREKMKGVSDIYRLLRIKNSLGLNEWTGTWNDRSEEIEKNKKTIMDILKKKYGNTKEENKFLENDGSFFMNYTDFLKIFSRIFICRSFPPTYIGVRISDNLPKRSGGLPIGENPEKNFLRNPQYYLNLKKETKIFIHLSQTDARLIGGNIEKYPYININKYITILIFETKEKKLKNDMSDIKGEISIELSRDICREEILPKGEYIIIPSTKDKNESKEVIQFFLEFYFMGNKLESVNNNGVIFENISIEKLGGKPGQIEIINDFNFINSKEPNENKMNFMLKNLKYYLQDEDNVGDDNEQLIHNINELKDDY